MESDFSFTNCLEVIFDVNKDSDFSDLIAFKIGVMTVALNSTFW